MINIDHTSAKRLVLTSGYRAIYTEKVKTNGGNSAKINCRKEYIDNEVVVFVLDEENLNLMNKEKEVKMNPKIENAREFLKQLSPEKTEDILAKRIRLVLIKQFLEDTKCQIKLKN